MKTDILFILKLRKGYEDYSFYSGKSKCLSTGLYNSAVFVNDMLNEQGFTSNLEVAIDNNCIDRLVTIYNPKIAIIEALWVVPEKFEVLQALHPSVTWVVRLHSEVPFMAQEGIAYKWIKEYVKYSNVYVAANAPRMLSSVKRLVGGLYHKVKYLPNYYPITDVDTKVPNRKARVLNVGCFGAIRPLKNQVHQALAAIEFAENNGKRLAFHVNGDRVETRGEEVLKNLFSIFENSRGHTLIRHEWLTHENFLEVCNSMDIGMQVSFSETFNIVSADMLAVGVPIVVSSEVPFAAPFFTASPVCQKSMVTALGRAYRMPKLNRWLSYKGLKYYNRDSITDWKFTIRNLLA